MMRSLRVGLVSLCLGLASALWLGLVPAAALAQNQVVEYGPLQEMRVGDYPLALAVTGWDPPGFTNAWKQSGPLGTPDPFITRYEGRFAHGPYFGRVLFID